MESPEKKKKNHKKESKNTNRKHSPPSPSSSFCLPPGQSLLNEAKRRSWGKKLVFLACSKKYSLAFVVCLNVLFLICTKAKMDPCDKRFSQSRTIRQTEDRAFANCQMDIFWVKTTGSQAAPGPYPFAQAGIFRVPSLRPTKNITGFLKYSENSGRFRRVERQVSAPNWSHLSHQAENVKGSTIISHSIFPLLIVRSKKCYFFFVSRFQQANQTKPSTLSG